MKHYYWVEGGKRRPGFNLYNAVDNVTAFVEITFKVNGAIGLHPGFRPIHIFCTGLNILLYMNRTITEQRGLTSESPGLQTQPLYPARERTEDWCMGEKMYLVH